MILRGYFYSSALEMDTGLTVALPDKFDDGSGYRVVYLLHGLCGNSDSWVANTMLPVYMKDYDAIFIMPEVGRSFYVDLQYGQRFLDYVVRELPEVSGRLFRISSAREDTAVIGGSMGGYGALKCAFARPERYGCCAALSSACLFLKEGLASWGTQEGIEANVRMFGLQMAKDLQAAFGERWTWRPEEDVLALAARAANSPLKPRFYSCCGDSDSLLEDNRRFGEEMKKMGFDFTFEERQVGHDWAFFDLALKRALEFCFGR